MESGKRQRVLVTGHAGYIGSVTVPTLLRAGYEVVGLDTYYYEGCDLGAAPESATKAIRKDVREVTLGDLSGFTAVIHLAALCNDPLGDLNPALTMEINYRASVRLAQLARDAGVERFIYASSCSMYGASAEDLLNEDAPLRPVTAYAESKVRTEADVSKLAAPGFSPVFMRNATAYGASPRFRADLVLNNLTCWGYAAGRIRIISDGTPWRPIVHVEDISRAFEAALTAPLENIHNQSLNVGADSENYQVRDLAAIVKEIMPECEIEYAGEGGPDPRSYRVSFERIGKLLPSFKPRWNARRGAAEVREALKHARMTPQEFQGRRFTRLLQLEHLLESGRLTSSLRWNSETPAASSPVLTDA